MTEAYEVWNLLLAKAASQGVQSLVPPEAAVYWTNRFLSDIESGGLSGALYSLSPPDLPPSGSRWHDLRATADALKFIGAGTASLLLDQVAAIVEGHAASGASTWGAFIQSVDPSDHLQGLHRELSALIPSLWGTLEEYTMAHLVPHS